MHNIKINYFLFYQLVNILMIFLPYNQTLKHPTPLTLTSRIIVTRALCMVCMDLKQSLYICCDDFDLPTTNIGKLINGHQRVIFGFVLMGFYTYKVSRLNIVCVMTR